MLETPKYPEQPAPGSGNKAPQEKAKLDADEGDDDDCFTKLKRSSKRNLYDVSLCATAESNTTLYLSTRLQ